MSTPTIRVDIDATSVDFALEKMQSVLSFGGMSQFFFGFVQQFLQQRAINRFEGEGDDAVGKWNELAQATVEIRENLGFNGAHPINKRTGGLEEYITSASGLLENLGNASQFTFPGHLPQEGEPMDKLIVAQKGGTSRSGSPIPPRPVLGINETDALAFTTELSLQIGEALSRV